MTVIITLHDVEAAVRLNAELEREGLRTEVVSPLDDIRGAAVPPRCGTTGTGTPGHYFPRLMEEVLGLKFNLVIGYPGASDIDLAIEKGEVQCRAGTTSAFFGREPGRTWAKGSCCAALAILPASTPSSSSIRPTGNWSKKGNA